jgi:hypothetical protein
MSRYLATIVAACAAALITVAMLPAQTVEPDSPLPAVLLR